MKKVRGRRERHEIAAFAGQERFSLTPDPKEGKKVGTVFSPFPPRVWGERNPYRAKRTRARAGRKGIGKRNFGTFSPPPPLSFRVSGFAAVSKKFFLFRSACLKEGLFCDRDFS